MSPKYSVDLLSATRWSDSSHIDLLSAFFCFWLTVWVVSIASQVAAAMKSGCDIGCDPYLNDWAKDALIDGEITEDTLDTALKRAYLLRSMDRTCKNWVQCLHQR